MTRRLAVPLAVAVASVLLLAPQPRSGASFTARKSTANNAVQADSPANYLRLFSQASDPAGLTGYAVKSQSVPAVPAAVGADGQLVAALGGWKLPGTMDRVLTIQARSPLPVASITVAVAVTPVLGQPVTSALLANVGSPGGTPSVTLAAGDKRQVNLVLIKLAGNNILYTASLTLKVTYAGYSGDFLTYTVPLTVWDGNGSGP
jgi:hypothetical protein